MELQQISGLWHIYATNFPMWLSGKRTNPTFQYTLDKYEKGIRLIDVVSYHQNGNFKTINGYDFPLNKANTAFEWRGKGWMYFIKSKWKIIHVSPDEEWMIIYFEKTLFTPKGFDVITRCKDPSEKIRAEIKTFLSENRNIPTLKALNPQG